MLRDFPLVFIEDILLHDLHVCKHLERLMRALHFVCALLEHGVSNGALLILVGKPIVVLNER